MRIQKQQLLFAALLLIGCMYAAWDFDRVGQIFRPPPLRSAAYQDNPLEHAKKSWLFNKYANFAELTTTQVTAENAAVVYPLAKQVMHYSPEPKVVQRAIDSAKYLGYDEEAQLLSARMKDQGLSKP